MGALPIAFGFGADGESRRPLGLVIVGGLIVSQLITLYITPAIYLYLEEFQERVPLLARGLVEKIEEAHAQNPTFREAFAKFFALCQTTLNPNIRREAVDEMLVQHLLTDASS